MKRFELPEMEIAMFDKNIVTTLSGGGDTEQITLTKGATGVGGNDILSDTVSTYSINFNAIDMAQ